MLVERVARLECQEEVKQEVKEEEVVMEEEDCHLDGRRTSTLPLGAPITRGRMEKTNGKSLLLGLPRRWLSLPRRLLSLRHRNQQGMLEVELHAVRLDAPATLLRVKLEGRAGRPAFKGILGTRRWKTKVEDQDQHQHQWDQHQHQW